MRYVSTTPPLTAGTNTNLVQGLTTVHAVKPVRLNDMEIMPARQLAVRKEDLRSVGQDGREFDPSKDRRKICRRVGHQHILIELRSDFDRRRHNLLGSDLVEHIDEEA